MKHLESKSVPISRPLSAGEALSRLPIKSLEHSPLSLEPLNLVVEDIFTLDGPILSPLPIKGSPRIEYEDSNEITLNEVDLSSSMKAKNEFMEIVLGNNNLYKDSFKRKSSSGGPKKTGLAF